MLTEWATEGGNRLLFGRATERTEHTGLQPEHRPTAERELDLCRNYRARWVKYMAKEVHTNRWLIPERQMYDR